MRVDWAWGKACSESPRSASAWRGLVARATSATVSCLLIFSLTFLALVAVLLWIALAATALTLNNSDPAGNAIASAFAALEAIALWIILAILLLMAAGTGRLPGLAG